MLWVVLLLSLAAVALEEDAPLVHDELANRMLLEAASFALEVRGEPELALQSLRKMTRPDAEAAEFRIRWLLLELRCLLQLGRTTEVRQRYRQLRGLASSNRQWMEWVHSWVPESLIQREVPWSVGEARVYLLSQPGKELPATRSGMVVTFLDRVGGTDAPDSDWRLQSWLLANDFRMMEVQLDRDSLQLRSSQLRSQPLLEMDKIWLGLTDTKPNLQMEGWAFRASLLQQCKFQLGMERTLTTFSLDGGGLETVDASVSTVELLQLPHASPERMPCWIATVLSESGDHRLREDFAFSQDAQVQLVRYRSPHMEAHWSQDHQVEVHGNWISIRLPTSDTLRPDVEAPQLLSIHRGTGVRCYHFQSVDTSQPDFSELPVDGMEPDATSLYSVQVKSRIFEGVRLLAPNDVGEQRPMVWVIREVGARQHWIVIADRDSHWSTLITGMQPLLQMAEGGGHEP